MERLTGEHLEQHAAERVDVGAGIDIGEPARLLGRHVARGPDRDPRRGHQVVGLEVVGQHLVVLAAHLRHAPVEHVGLAEVAEHDVLGLEVAVHDPVRVGELDREAHVRERAQQALQRVGAGPRAALTRWRIGGEDLRRA